MGPFVLAWLFGEGLIAWRSVQQQKELPSSFKDGVVEITTPLAEADYLLLPR